MHCGLGPAVDTNPIQREPLLVLAAIVETVETMEAGIEIQAAGIVIQEVEIVSSVAETEAVVVVDCFAVAKSAVFPLSSHCATQVRVLAGDVPGVKPGTCRQAGHGCTCTDPPGYTCQTA